MPSSPPDSTGSPPPSATPSADAAAATPLAWRTNAWLFAATVSSVLFTHTYLTLHQDPPPTIHRAFTEGLQFTAALLSILLAHEFGHFVAARIHKVDASLPFFIPLPLASPFGTMGAVIRMRSVIPTRRALLDIGASGPLAGLALAIPLYAWGAQHSTVIAAIPSGGGELGEPLLMRLVDHLFAPAVPDGSDLLLSPVAFAAWAGMFVTMINLLPAGQLDGGHVAYALFGPRQNTIARWVHRSMLAFFFVSLASYVGRDVRAGLGLWQFGRHVNNALFWLVWFEVLAVLGALSSRREAGDTPLSVRMRAVATLGIALLAGVGRESASIVFWGAWFAGLAILIAMEVQWGALRPASALLDHPPTGAQPLGAGRAAVAVITLALFALLFMPTPIAM